jgi:short-subunit dehydrogenase
MENMQTVLITGGSSGFGLEFAKLFARDGYRLVLVAKPAEMLAEAADFFQKNHPDVPVVTRVQDLSLLGAGQALYDWARAEGIVPDVLVNNAGFGTYGFFDDIDPARDHEMFRLNALTVYDLTRLFGRDMIARDAGKILNVSSNSALQPTPLLSAYSATKAFVLQISMGFDYELRRRGSRVRIVALCPPGSPTGFIAAAGMQHTAVSSGFWSLSPEAVARAGYRALQRGERMRIPGPVIGFLMKLLNRLLPTSLKLWLVYDQTRARKH